MEQFVSKLLFGTVMFRIPLWETKLLSPWDNDFGVLLYIKRNEELTADFGVVLQIRNETRPLSTWDNGPF